MVTGGAGFIGSHLCKSLLDQGNIVTCIDNLSTGSERNINPLLKNQNFSFKKIDVCDEDRVSSLANFQEIYHLASPASVTYVVRYPIKAALANSIGTKNLLELAAKNNSKFLFTSSSEVYGDPKEHPQKESYWGNVNPIGVRSGYDEGKRFGEALCMAYYRTYKIDIKIVRVFNTYGMSSSPEDSRVVPRIVTQALKNQPLTVHGDGHQTRSFCYVQDMVEGIVKMMQSSQMGPINIGNTKEYKVLDLVKTIQRMTGTKSEIVFVERPQDDPSQRRPDITLAQRNLSWEPKISLVDGLGRTIEYFKNVLSI